MAIPGTGKKLYDAPDGGGATPTIPQVSTTVRNSQQAQRPGVTDPGAIAASGNPTMLANLLRQQRGQTGPNRGGRIAQYSDDFYGKALAVLAQLSPTLDGATLDKILADVGSALGGGQGLGGMMRGAGQQAMQGFDPLSVNSDQAAARLAAIQAGLGYGSGGYQQDQLGLMSDTLNNDLDSYELRGGSDFFADNPIDKTDYWKRLVAMAGQR